MENEKSSLSRTLHEPSATDLSVLADPEKPTLDIVFVHGFKGHPVRTWSHKTEFVIKDRSEHYGDGIERPAKIPRLSFATSHLKKNAGREHVYWPQHLIPKSLPTARVLVYGYDTNVRHSLGPPISKLEIEKINWSCFARIVLLKHVDPRPHSAYCTEFYYIQCGTAQRESSTMQLLARQAPGVVRYPIKYAMDSASRSWGPFVRRTFSIDQLRRFYNTFASRAQMSQHAKDINSILGERDGEKKQVVRKSGFYKQYSLSEPLADLVGETQLSRFQVVKKIWDYIKARDLQDPNDKRQIRCDNKMQLVFQTDRVHMFTMNKILGKHLYSIEES